MVLGIEYIPNLHGKERLMTTRNTRRRPVRPIPDALAGPRELFGESLPELLLVTAIVAAVVGGVLALNGVS
jgi:hypothetical protein